MSVWTDQSANLGTMARTPVPGTRDTILTAAAGLFYRYGVRAVGMAQVVEVAGCGKNLLYRHFPSKAQLAAAYLRLSRREREQAAAEALRWAHGPAGQLIALVAEIAESTRRPGWRGCAFRNYLTEFPGATDEPAQLARAYLADSRAVVDRLVTELGGDALLADRIWLIVDALHSSPPDQARVAVDWVTELIRDTTA
ncbi:TetR family transcriptional regulator [Actinoplanes sp. SE50]|nr:HTH-type transcriptional regulator betI [Actinoplanes sp. SE50/110]ATO81926.1 TetR family transcriptional regulator [Actinoplanes sp. SE50]SLL99334.1 TetR family transcriptional regulator [Actinoplanes sp. SE50/110]